MNIFLFHRDLRVEDNIALGALLRKTTRIYLFFIFNRHQKDPRLNPYFSAKSFAFLQKRLFDLNQEVRINFFEASSEKQVFAEVMKTQQIQRIYTNKDFTPFAKQRDKELADFCQRNNIEYNSAFNDYLLCKPGLIVNKNGGFCKVFTPFYNGLLLKSRFVLQPSKQWRRITCLQVQNRFSTTVKKPLVKFTVCQTRDEAFQSVKNQGNYQRTRDVLSLDKGTSQIAPCLKYGVISVREAFWFAIRCFKTNKHPFVRQLVWREFFYHHYVLASYQKSYVFGQNINRKFDHFPWVCDANHPDFTRWKNGKTRVAIVDAAMNQLNTTGFMHNRARMIVASYLTKDLNIHWKLGEKYFAQKLIDYDPIVNQQSWQWVAGPGLDYQSYYRIFAPETQVKKFDPDKKFIKKYLPPGHQVQQENLKKTRDLFRQRLKKWKESTP